ncbi:unnamed protein product [Brassica rapa subsp. trilocularis]
MCHLYMHKAGSDCLQADLRPKGEFCRHHNNGREDEEKTTGGGPRSNKEVTNAHFRSPTAMHTNHMSGKKVKSTDLESLPTNEEPMGVKP